MDNNRHVESCKDDEGAATKTTVASEVVQHEVPPQDNPNVCPTTRDTSLNDVLATTTMKPDGR